MFGVDLYTGNVYGDVAIESFTMWKENSVIIHVIHGRYMPALTNAQIMIFHFKKCSHLDITW